MAQFLIGIWLGTLGYAAAYAGVSYFVAPPGVSLADALGIKGSLFGSPTTSTGSASSGTAPAQSPSPVTSSIGAIASAPTGGAFQGAGSISSVIE